MSVQIVIVLWNGGVGGAETLMGDIARSMLERSIDTTVLCIGDCAPLAERLDAKGVTCRSLEYRRGSAVILHPRHVAAAVRELGRDGAIVNATGYLPWLIRIGGYRSPMLAVEHGDALNVHTASHRRRLRLHAERWICAKAGYTDVAVSDTLLQASERVTGRSNGMRIYNGVNLHRFVPSAHRVGRQDRSFTIGTASRLAPGKGIEVLLKACSLLGVDSDWTLCIAGEGPEGRSLRAQVDRDPRLRERVTFLGMISDMPGFWRACDIAVVPSSRWIESFSMAAVEAMACGLPVIASSSGALPEICGASCGMLVAPGDPDALSAALLDYISNRSRCRVDGAAGRRRAEECFDIEDTVTRYAEALGLSVAQRGPERLERCASGAGA